MYSIGHIYKIICSLDSSFCYIGSTFNELRHRFQNHKTKYKTQTGVTIYEYFKKYGIENFKIIKIKSYNVYRSHNKDDLHLKVYETLWINKTKNCINKIAPFNPLRKNKRFLRMYLRPIMKERNKYDPEYQKKYRENNKQKLKEQSSEKIICERCNAEIKKRSKCNHVKSKKCIEIYEKSKKDKKTKI